MLTGHGAAAIPHIPPAASPATRNGNYASQALGAQSTRSETLQDTSSISNGAPGISQADPSTVLHELHQADSLPASHNNATRPFVSVSGHETLETPSLDFNSLDLVCSIDADGISNRWLNPYIPAPEQKAKAYDPTVTAFIHRMLQSYAAIAVHGRGIPPFVHPLQLHAGAESAPLEICLNVVRLFERSTSETTTPIDVLRREMDRIYDFRLAHSVPAALAAFQAYLVYSLTLFFWTGDSSSSIMVQCMMQLQELASITAKQGIVCPEEEQYTRPKWEAWIVAEAKRRTMYIMYLFDGLLSARDGLPSFLGTELRGLYAPACQKLWHSPTRPDWERSYNQSLAQWPEGYLTIDELWPAPPDLDEAGVSKRRARVDQWLEDVDKFGTMLFAVTSYIHKN